MQFKKLGSTIVLAGILSAPNGALAQTTVHEEAKAQQNAHDKRHHNTAKVVGGSAAAGAVGGALLGGPKGAVVGAGVGAGGGVIGDKIRKKKGTEKREKKIRSEDHESGYSPR